MLQLHPIKLASLVYFSLMDGSVAPYFDNREEDYETKDN